MSCCHWGREYPFSASGFQWTRVRELGNAHMWEFGLHICWHEKDCLTYKISHRTGTMAQWVEPLCCLAWRTELHLQSVHGGRQEPTPQSCLWPPHVCHSPCTCVYTYTHSHSKPCMRAHTCSCTQQGGALDWMGEERCSNEDSSQGSKFSLTRGSTFPNKMFLNRRWRVFSECPHPNLHKQWSTDIKLPLGMTCVYKNTLLRQHLGWAHITCQLE